jgi:hypothetical protein
MSHEVLTATNEVDRDLDVFRHIYLTRSRGEAQAACKRVLRAVHRVHSALAAEAKLEARDG